MENAKEWKENFSKRLVRFTVSVLQLARKNENDKLLAPIFNQVIRSASSVGANITEANGSMSKAGFSHYFRIALQSANETRYWFNVLSEVGIKEKSELTTIENELIELIKIVTASLKTMNIRK